MSYKPNTTDLTRQGCVEYIENWIGLLQEEINEIGIDQPQSLLQKEQVDFLTKTVLELKK